MQKNKQDIFNQNDNYVRLLEASNIDLHKKLHKTKRKNIIFFLSFLTLVSLIIVFFLYKNHFSINDDIFKNHLSTVKFDKTKLLIQDNSGKYYEINTSTNLKYLANQDLFVEVNSNFIRFSNLQVPNIKNYTFNIYTPDKKYKIILPDDTKILLNKQSKITFSTNRKTTLTNAIIEGEAFFKVAHNPKQAFVVKASDMKVKVLGTAFDIYNYKDKNNTKVSLLKGSVEVSAYNKKTKIKPGEEAICSDNKSIKVKLSNVYDAINWTEEQFSFKEMKLSKIITKLEKWYKVRFVLKDEKLKNLHFTGIIIKKQGLRQFLKTLQYTENIRFSMDGNTIILTK